MWWWRCPKLWHSQLAHILGLIINNISIHIHYIYFYFLSKFSWKVCRFFCWNYIYFCTFCFYLLKHLGFGFFFSVYSTAKCLPPPLNLSQKAKKTKQYYIFIAFVYLLTVCENHSHKFVAQYWPLMNFAISYNKSEKNVENSNNTSKMKNCLVNEFNLLFFLFFD